MKNILVFSDFACPFCYLGFSIMEKFHKENPEVKIDFAPAILNPNETIEGSDLFDHVPEEVALQGFKRFESLGEEYGLIYNNKRNRFNTNRLHKAGFYAKEKNKYFEFAQLGFKYIFEYGKNVGKVETINEIASSIGLDIDEMNKFIDSGKYDNSLIEAAKLAEKYQIDSVPTFIVDDVKKPTTLKSYDEFIKELQS